MCGPGLHTDVSEERGGRQWTNTDKTTVRYVSWRAGSPCRRTRCARSRCVAVGGRRQLVDRRCDRGRRRAVCARPAVTGTGRSESATRRRRRPPTANT